MKTQPSGVLDAYYSNLTKVFDRVVEWVFQRGRLQQFPRIVQYMAKMNGGLGWEDSYQNLLITRLCASRWMKRDSDAIWTCTVDGSEWYRTSDEWRMMAYKDQLEEMGRSKAKSLPAVALGAPAESSVFFSEDFFRTVGADPADLKRIDLAGIVQYLTQLTSGEYLVLDGPPVEITPTKPTLWHCIWRALGG